MVVVSETVVPARVAFSAAGDANTGGPSRRAPAHHLPDTGVLRRRVREHHPTSLQVSRR